MEDAIHVTKALDIRYLWVDRYCIDQTNEEEKHHTICNMDVIYEGAFITIIAASGDGPDAGLPGVEQTPRSQLEFKFLDNGWYTVFQNPRVDIRKSIWSIRGWTYQEMLLSRRRLVFTPSQIYFQCEKGHCVENAAQIGDKDDMPNSGIRHATEGFPRLGTAYTDTYIYDRLEEYYYRQFSFNVDITKAFIGVLHAFDLEDWSLPPRVPQRESHGVVHWATSSSSRHLRASHVHGVPLFYFDEVPTERSRKSFLVGLTWKVSGNSTWPVLLQRSLVFPSWSWASIKCDRPTKDCGRLVFPQRHVNVWSKLQDDIRVYCYAGSQPLELTEYTKSCEDRGVLQPWIDITSWSAGSVLQPATQTNGTGRLAGFKNGKLYLDYPKGQKEIPVILILLGAFAALRHEEVILLVVEQVNSYKTRRIGLFSSTFMLRSTIHDIVATITPEYTFDYTGPESDEGLSFVTQSMWRQRTLRLI